MSIFDTLDQIKQNFDKGYFFSTVKKITSISKFGIKIAKKALKVITNVEILFMN